MTLKRLRGWAASLREKGFLVILKVRMVKAATPSIMTALESAQKWSKTDFHDL